MEDLRQALTASSLKLVRDERLLWDNVPFALRPGQTIAITGGNGSGKSSLLECLCGLRNPVHGKVFWRNQDITQINRRLRARLLRSDFGVVPQGTPIMENETVRTHFLVALPKRTKEPDTLMSKFLSEVGLQMIDPRQEMGKLSLGQRQRALVAIALSKSPQILFLDEPTSALDGDGRLTVAESLASYTNTGGIVCLVSHDNRLINTAQQVIRVGS